ncbi:MAG: acetylornithine transaminase [Burkholderiales bacterium]|jgi:acetylornithine aminotransferase|nr:acetylornithine transaminase [Burkholderiales bacterium]
MSALMHTYGRLPVAFDHGEGVWVFDTEGRRYLDALTGIAVTGLGHAHPRVVAAIAAQAGRLIHASNLYRIPEQEHLAATLVRHAAMDRVFFCNSGCEANEAAIKLARLHGHQRGIAQPVIVVMEKAFHGRTMATLSATGSRKVQAGFEPLLGGFARVPYADIDALRHVAEHDPNVVAVLMEPVQGEGGIHPADDGFLREVRSLTRAHDWLLMVDEVQCGLGRTGRWFAHQHAGIVPDVMTLAKGLGNGVPIGACVAAGRAAEVFTPGKHGSTFGGNPLACAAAQAVLDTIEADGLVAHAGALGAQLRADLQAALADVPAVVEVRGRGLMLGIQLDRPCGELVGLALERGLLINVTADSVVRLLPPLVLQAEQAQLLVDTLADLIRTWVALPHAAAA